LKFFIFFAEYNKIWFFSKIKKKKKSLLQYQNSRKPVWWEPK